MSILDEGHLHIIKFEDSADPSGTYLDTKRGREKMQADLEKLWARGKEGAWVATCERDCLIEHRKIRSTRKPPLDSQGLNGADEPGSCMEPECVA